jgi:hypothetical protein
VAPPKHPRIRVEKHKSVLFGQQSQKLKKLIDARCITFRHSVISFVEEAVLGFTALSSREFAL